jgi:hypothetical protein
VPKRSQIALAAAAIFVGILAANGRAQPPAAGAGSILWRSANIKGPNARLALARKRFFLYKGSLVDNDALVKTLTAAEIASRDCFYSDAKASPCFIKWLEEENCESPFCRKVSETDLTRVPEFKTAYDKGIGLYGKRADLALEWIFDSMPGVLLSGYPLKRRSMLDDLSGRFPFIQQISTTASAEGRFVGLAPGIYTVTNLLPIEINQGSYVWIAQAEIKENALNSTLVPSLTPKREKWVFVRKDLKRCSTAECEAK